ncbi:MAG TPA: hypothetical protein PLW97_04980 [Synergistaceae bacterium]|nr:hypothetical protein [Synergistaceae bacterium]HPQ36982.1 hypothetical protein [Synergistaceae bacterium]
MDLWKGPFCGALPLEFPPEDWSEAVAFPVLLVPGEALVRGILNRGEYRKGIIAVDAFIGYGEVLWNAPFPVFSEKVPEKRYESRFPLEKLLEIARNVLEENVTRGIMGRFRGILPYLQIDKIAGCWRIYAREGGFFRDCFTGKERPELDFIQHLAGSREN